MTMNHVDVFALDALSASIRDLHTARREIGECCDEGIRKAEQMLQNTQGELQFSETLLAAAQVEEAAKLALQLKADARMAAAAAEETSAIASCNPFAIAAASAEIAAAAAELAEATEEYQRAREHRERLEHRRNLAQKCLDLAQANLDMLRLRYQYGRAQVGKIVISGCGRLQAAHDDLEAYLARISPQARQSIRDYKSWKPEEKRPISRRFTLAKGKNEYRFVLVSNDLNRKTQYAAVVRNPAFPLAQDAVCRLDMTYRYGAEDPYRLIFIPESPAAGFAEAKVSQQANIRTWAFPSRSRCCRCPGYGGSRPANQGHFL